MPQPHWHVRRVKQGSPSTHPILGDELRSLRRLQREQEPKSPFVFTSERGAPFSTAGFARMIERAGAEANFGSRHIRIFCGTPAALRWHLRDTTRARFRLILVTRTFSTRCDTPSFRLHGSGIFGVNDNALIWPQIWPQTPAPKCCNAVGKAALKENSRVPPRAGLHLFTAFFI